MAVPHFEGLCHSSGHFPFCVLMSVKHIYNITYCAGICYENMTFFEVLGKVHKKAPLQVIVFLLLFGRLLWYH